MTINIEAWLADLGLEQYRDAFRENEIDAEVLPTVTSEDLRDIGVRIVGHRRKLLNAIAQLDTGDDVSDEPNRPGAFEAQRSGQRRQLTVLFCDLVGSTELSRKLDPEDLADVIRNYHRVSTQIIERWGGHVAKYLGDGVLAYFGYPVAHEEDAERSVRAGLELISDVAGMRTPDGTHLSARVGIATGLVMVGELIGTGTSQEENVVGETPNLAARLEAKAKPGEVVIPLQTRVLLGDLFVFRDLGAHYLKGFDDPIELFSVSETKATESRFAARTKGKLTPLVGRQREHRLLCDLWDDAQAGDGQIALISGEAGIGKSRLIEALREHLRDQPHNRLRYQCSPFHLNTAFYPFIDQLRSAAGFEKGDEPEQQADKLEHLLRPTSDDRNEVLSLFASLLSMPTSRYPETGYSAQRQLQRTFDVLADQLSAICSEVPVVVLFEDLHWIDPTSLELLDRIVSQVGDLRALVVFTFRPEFKPTWLGQPNVHSSLLNRLTKRHCTDMIVELSQGKALPTRVLDEIVKKTDGVPLFIEELTKHVLESGLVGGGDEPFTEADPVPLLAIPGSLQESLLSRLDRLDSVKSIAQIGAAIGRDFSFDLLATVAGISEQKLTEALKLLVSSELVHQHGQPPTAIYTFKHSLVQDAAYSTILRSRRRRLHERIVEVMEEQLGDHVTERVDTLAYHTYAGEIWEKAFTYLWASGTRAMQRSALHEAAAQFEHALEAASKLPKSTSSQLKTIDVKFELRNALWALGRFEDILTHLREAEKIAAELMDPVRAGWISVFKSASNWQLGRSNEAIEAADAALCTGEESENLSLCVAANFYLGCAYVTTGNCRRAEELFGAVTDALTGELRREQCGLPFAPAVIARSWIIWALAERGQFIQGQKLVEEGIDLAMELQHPFNLAHIYYDVGCFYETKGDVKQAVAAHEKAYGFVTGWGLTYLSPFIMGFLGHSYALAGRHEESLSFLDRAQKAYEDIGLGLFRSLIGIHRGEAYFLAGNIDQARQITTEAVDLARSRGEQGHQAHGLRVLGTIASKSDEPDRGVAERLFGQAMSLANAHRMRPLVAQCHLCLGDLLQNVQGGHEEGEEHIQTGLDMARDMELQVLPHIYAARE